jgi:hypothetical protein
MDLKKAKLDDDAAIYNHGPEKTDREKWAEMNGKQRWDYFKTYYLKIVLAVLLGLVLLGSLIYSIAKPKPKPLLRVAVSNFNYINFNPVSDAYLEAKGLNNGKTTMQIDTGYALDSDYNSTQRFTVYVFAGDLDMLISPSAVFERYATNDLMVPLDEVLDADLFEKLKSNDLLLYASVTKTAPDGTVLSVAEKKAYGVNLKDIEFFEKYIYDGNIPFAGVIGTSKAQETSADFIKFLFDGYYKNK